MPASETHTKPSAAAPTKSASDVSIIDVLPQHRLDEPALGKYLQQHLDDFSVPAQLRQFRGGQSNPTYLIETHRAE